MTISLCMIVKDEETTLPRCLKSAEGLYDELVIADTGSTDGTVAIARDFGAEVFPFRWINDFSAARNYAFSKAHGDYLMWLDADDFLPAENDTAALRSLLATSPDVVTCPYVTAFDCEGNPALTFRRERFLRREAGFRWQGRVHECIAQRGKIVNSDFRVFHLGSEKRKGTRNLDIYRKWEQEEPLSGRDLFYYGRELFYHGFYREAAQKLEEMLAGEGWYVNKIEACRTLAGCLSALGERERARTALFCGFLYGEPRAYMLCEIGRSFFEEKRYREAVFWYESALRCRDHTEEGDFEEPACRSVVPLLQLVCCYYALGDVRRAVLCHKKTEELSPDHPSVRFNRELFSKQGLL